ncbi:MAG: MerR family transcriptional regulator [Gammaproteobacteria bacterium]|nr:MerR family transcriptional regulator [Gammaproteobacteria bacterium]
MTRSEVEVLTGAIVECGSPLTLEELCRLCAVDSQRIVALAEEGILPGATGPAQHWRFGGAALRRARVALRLQRDLEVNLAGVALVLDLLDEIEELRRRR